MNVLKQNTYPRSQPQFQLGLVPQSEQAWHRVASGLHKLRQDPVLRDIPLFHDLPEGCGHQAHGRSQLPQGGEGEIDT